ncbi:MAG: POTRA domain-containing protein, partial [Acidobacteriota bacterium]
LIPIEEGPLYTLESLTVRNVTVFETSTVMQLCPLRQGEAYSRRKVNEWIERLRESYRELGYIRATGTAREEIHEFKRSVVCAVDFTEGAVYHVGKIRVTEESIDPADFKKRLLVGEGAVFNPAMLAHTIQFLNLARTFRPFGHGDVEVLVDDETRTVDLVFHIVPLKKKDFSREERQRI